MNCIPAQSQQRQLTVATYRLLSS